MRAFATHKSMRPSVGLAFRKLARVRRQPTWSPRFQTHYGKHSRRDPTTGVFEDCVGLVANRRKTDRFLKRQLLSFDLRRIRTATTTRPPQQDTSGRRSGRTSRTRAGRILCASADAKFPQVGGHELTRADVHQRLSRLACSTLAMLYCLRKSISNRSISSHCSVEFTDCSVRAR